MKERPRYFHVPVVKHDKSYGGYETMEECVAKHGTGQLVADHVLLDDVDAQAARIAALEGEVKALEIVKSEMHNYRDKWLALQAEILEYKNTCSRLEGELAEAKLIISGKTFSFPPDYEALQKENKTLSERFVSKTEYEAQEKQIAELQKENTELRRQVAGSQKWHNETLQLRNSVARISEDKLKAVEMAQQLQARLGEMTAAWALADKGEG